MTCGTRKSCRDAQAQNHATTMPQQAPPACDFNVLDASELESSAELLMRQEHPVLLRNAFSWRAGMADKARFVERFGDFPFLVGTDLEAQSATSKKSRHFSTTIRDWVQTWADNSSAPRYAFTWLEDARSHELNSAILQEYPWPEAVRVVAIEALAWHARHAKYASHAQDANILKRQVRWASAKLFFVIGQQSPGIRVHNHPGFTWVALLEGTKQWYVTHRQTPGEKPAGFES